jgi:hypothetical protein
MVTTIGLLQVVCIPIGVEATSHKVINFFVERVISLLHTLYAAMFQIGGRGFCSIWNLNPLGKGITCIDFNKFVYMMVNFVLENA